MRICNFGRYKPIETALKHAGLRVTEVVKQGKKTVITVSQCKNKGKNHNEIQPFSS